MTLSLPAQFYIPFYILALVGVLSMMMGYSEMDQLPWLMFSGLTFILAYYSLPSRQMEAWLQMREHMEEILNRVPRWPAEPLKEEES